MRTLSIHQPWASLIVAGKKRFEVRSWQTSHRGRMAIHACGRFPPTAHRICQREPYRSLLLQIGCDDWGSLPRGVVLGTAELVDCTRVEDMLWVPEQECLLSEFQPGSWVWEFADPLPLPSPIPLTGRLGVFESPLPISA